MNEERTYELKLTSEEWKELDTAILVVQATYYAKAKNVGLTEEEKRRFRIRECIISKMTKEEVKGANSDENNLLRTERNRT